MTDTEQVLEQIRRNWLFSAEPESELKAILRTAGVRQLEPNQTMFWQGEPVGHLFLVLDGSFKLVRRDRKQRFKVTGVAGASDLVALHCLFSDNGYATTAVAMEDSAVLAINAERFLWHVKQKPGLAWRVSLFLSREVEGLVQEVERLSNFSAAERLAGYLLTLYEEAAERNGERVPRRRADLASLLAVSTETLCREISKFRSRGWIATHDNGFTVLKPEALRGLIESGKTISDPLSDQPERAAGGRSGAMH